MNELTAQSKREKKTSYVYFNKFIKTINLN